MIKSEIIEATVKGRILTFREPIFSGETVDIKLSFDSGDADASKHKILLFGSDKTILAEGVFTRAFDGTWLATLNTATNEMAAYFNGVEVEGARSIGAMVVNAETADVITRGNVLVVCTPFPEDLQPCPKTFSYITEEEMDAALEPIEGNISSLSSDVSGLSSMVSLKADISSLQQIESTLSNKADLSVVENLSSNVYLELQLKANASMVNGMADTMIQIESTLSNKADMSVVTELSSTVWTALDNKIDSYEFNMVLDKVDTLSTDVESLSGEMANKAEASDLESVQMSLSSDIDSLMLNKADVSYVYDVEGNILNVVAYKAEQGAVDELSSKVDTMSDSVSGLSSDVATLSGNVDTLSASIGNLETIINAI